MQTIGLIVMLLVGVGILVGLVVTGRRNRDRVDPLQQRLSELGDRDALPTSLTDLELSLSRKDRIVLPIFDSLSKFVVQFTPENQIETIRLRLERAGKTDTEPAAFFAQRIFLTIILGVGAFVLFFFLADWPLVRGMLGTIGGTAIGYYLPLMQLDSQIKRRQERVLRQLPNALDLLTICVEAGLGFDTAMGKVYEKWDNELSNAFGRVLQEIQLGKLRREALRSMASRIDLPDLTTFVAAVVQAEQLGVSIGKILRVQADQMRVKRRQRAQEKAHQAPVKMMIPMVLLIFPSIWIVLMGPAVVFLIQTGTL